MLIPSNQHHAEATRPQFGELLPLGMNEIIADAKNMGISELEDVETMVNCFQCMSWALTALSILRRKPTVSEISFLIDMSSDLKLPDEKAIRTLKFMLNRTNQYQCKITKALAKNTGESKPLSASALKEIYEGAEELPLLIPEPRKVSIAVDDQGYPIIGEELSEPADDIGKKPSPDDDSRDCSPHAPDPSKLWPPFGLSGSKEAIEALGQECAAIPYTEDVPRQVDTEQNRPTIEKPVPATEKRAHATENSTHVALGTVQQNPDKTNNQVETPASSSTAAAASTNGPTDVSPMDMSQLKGRGKCVPMRPPIPLHFQGDMQKMQYANVPEYANIINFPTQNPPEGMGTCVMCGESCQISPKKKVREFLGSKRNQELYEEPIIPIQNKGLCTNCDVNVFVICSNGLQIKWCKGCKNFKPWAAFGEKGAAIKCCRCRTRERAREQREQRLSVDQKIENTLNLVKAVIPTATEEPPRYIADNHQKPSATSKRLRADRECVMCNARKSLETRQRSQTEQQRSASQR